MRARVFRQPAALLAQHCQRQHAYDQRPTELHHQPTKGLVSQQTRGFRELQKVVMAQHARPKGHEIPEMLDCVPPSTRDTARLASL